MYVTAGIPSPRLARGWTASGTALSLPLMWMTMASGAIVLMEPAPYDVLICGLLLLLPALGTVSISRAILILASAWALIAAGGFAAGIQAGSYSVPAKHTAISLFLSASAVLIAAFVAGDTMRHGRVILSGLAAGAVFTAAAGLLGYFSLVPGAWDLFTEFGRARAAFKDPNVYGPFIVPGLLWCLHMLISASRTRALAAIALGPLLLAGLLVSFSRGAWINMATALAVYGYLTMAVASSNHIRVRLAGCALAGFAILAILLLSVFQVPGVAEFLVDRATLLQDYDVGPAGRFTGQAKALLLIAENPLGIGALEFSRSYHAEDVHNVYLSMFLNAGWLGGFLYAGIVLATLLAGLRGCAVNSPTRGLLIVAVAAFAGLVCEGMVIDTDHWRHFYVIMGLIWGLTGGQAGGQTDHTSPVRFRQTP